MAETKETAEYRQWMDRIGDALKREKEFRKDAKEVVEIYEGEKVDETPFAILYSNTETLVPAVYSQPPTPIVDRRFKDADPIGKLAAETGTRVLKFLIDAQDQDNDTFDENVSADVLGALLANRGLSRVKYEADTSTGQVRNECVYFESVRYDKFYHGYARTWKKVPWIGFEWDMTPDEIRQNFGDEVADNCDFDSIPDSDDTGGRDEKSSDKMAGVKITKVHEIWDKTNRKVHFFAPCYKHGALKSVDDPLNLSGFFPVPKPINFMRKVRTLTPTPLYQQYKNQATELNQLTIRIKYMIKALKVRGFYNSTIQGIEKVLEAEDNVLLPAENMQALEGQAGSSNNMIWLMPVQELATTVQTLYQQREQVKQVIYEITGISDIIRGSSVASETATAQNIKNQWGTLRLKKMQKEVQRYCRDLLAIALEVAVTKFSVETISAMTGLPYPTGMEKQQVGMQMQMMQGQLQQGMMQAELSGQEPPPPPPEMQQMEEFLAQPAWEEVLELLKDDVQRHYRIDIETNSTIDAAASEDKQDIADLLNGLAQFMSVFTPAIQEGIMPFEVAKEMLLAITRRYTFGPQLEEAIGKMASPQPKSDPNEEAKMQVEQIKLQGEQAKMQMEEKRMGLEMQLEQARHQMEMEMLQMKMQLEREKLAMEQAKMQLDKAKAQMQLEFSQRQHQQKMMQADQQHQHKVATTQQNAELGMEVAETKAEHAKAMAAAKPEKKGKE